MIRPLGEQFKHKGVLLKVVEYTGCSACKSCYFAGEDCEAEGVKKIIGECRKWERFKAPYWGEFGIIFKEVKK